MPNCDLNSSESKSTWNWNTNKKFLLFSFYVSKILCSLAKDKFMCELLKLEICYFQTYEMITEFYILVVLGFELKT
jgi:hypothetical protein